MRLYFRRDDSNSDHTLRVTGLQAFKETSCVHNQLKRHDRGGTL